MQREYVSVNSKKSIQEVARRQLGGALLISSTILIFAILGNTFLQVITNPISHPSFLRK